MLLDVLDLFICKDAILCCEKGFDHVDWKTAMN